MLQNITLSYLFVGVIEQHPTDSEAAPNDVQGTTDTCIIPTLYLDMEHDSTLLERNTISVTSLSSMTQTIQSYYNYSRCCLWIYWHSSTKTLINILRTIVGHQFHCDFSVEVTLDDRCVDEIETEKIGYFFAIGCRWGPIGMVLVAEHSL